ncbi:MAG: hypothetical protein HYS32_00590 [Candidatus Woesearchaeota archaeon]|nr:MAG: hypothetical protein HYS32_00590 [Candidatus Woesearchaeota archaeon]
MLRRVYQAKQNPATITPSAHKGLTRVPRESPQRRPTPFVMSGFPLIIHPAWLDRGRDGQQLVFFTTNGDDEGCMHILRAIEAAAFPSKGSQQLLGAFYRLRRPERIGLVEARGKNPQELLETLERGSEVIPPIRVIRIGKDGDLGKHLGAFVSIAEKDLPESEEHGRVHWNRLRINGKSTIGPYANQLIEWYRTQQQTI